jgi:alkanesulfonate monooxygenase SsuD/methylene tetrahydromethanopterin reductase-like flavin-dependent oxidoreductase (luciferase family)
MDGYWQAVDRAGRDRNPYRAGFLQFVGIAEDEAHAEELYSGPALYFYQRCMHIYGGFASPPGYSTPSTLRRGIVSQVSQAAQGGRAGPGLAPAVDWKAIVDNGYIVVGDPKRVTEQLHEFADVMNVGHLMLLMHFGDMQKQTAMYNTRRFAQEVAPSLRARFSDWEDRWFPKGVVADAPQLAPAQ